MADNMDVTPGAGATIGLDEIGGVKYQRVKLIIGADGTNDGDVASGNPLPAVLTAGSAAIGKLAANSGVDIGDVDVTSCALPTGASTSAKQDTGNSSLSSIDGKITACNTGAVVLAAGTAGIGKLTANSGVDIGDVDILSIAAGDNNIGNVDLASAIPAGTNAIGKLLPPDIDITAHSNYARKYYTSAGAATDGIIWSPAAGKRWHVVTMYIQVSAAATVTLEDDKAGGDDPVWKAELAANSGVVLPFTEKYPLASGEDEADLTITTTAGNVYVTVVGYEV